MRVSIKHIYKDAEAKESAFYTMSFTVLHNHLMDILDEDKDVIRVEAIYYFVPRNCKIVIDREDTKP